MSQPGVTTDELDRLCHDFIVSQQQAIPANVGYNGFPKTICTSVNHVVCHGIPNDKKLQPATSSTSTSRSSTTASMATPAACTSPASPGAGRAAVARRAREAMWAGIRQVRPGARLGDIGHAIQTLTEGEGFSVVREYCGHGIGRIYHEDPQVLHYGQPGTGTLLREGMTFTIEPMINAGKRHVQLLEGWLDGGDQGPLAVGAVGTHHAGAPPTAYEVLTLGAAERDADAARWSPDGLDAAGLAGRRRCRHRRIEMPPWPLLDRLPQLLVEGELLARGLPRADRRAAQAELQERFTAEESVEVLVRARALFIDALLRATVAAAAAAGAGRSAWRCWQWAATAAANCIRYSDVDILILTPTRARAVAPRTRAAGTAHHLPVGHRP